MSEPTGNQPGMVNNTPQTLPTGQVPAVPTQTQPPAATPVQVQTPQQAVQPPVVPPAPATLPPAPAVPAMPPTPSQLRRQDPNVDMDRQFNHLRGELNARANDWQTWQGQVEQINLTLAQDLAAARQEASQAQAQLQRAQGFEAQAQQSQTLAQQNDRFARLIRYPVILQQGTVQQVTDEQGQVQSVNVNPYLDLLMSSNLQGDNFEAAVQRLASTLQPQQQQVVAPQAQNVPAGTPQQVQAPVAPQQPVAPQMGQFNPAAALTQALPNVGPGVPLNQGLSQQFQQPGMPSMMVTPPAQPIMSAQQQIAQLEQQRDDASDAGDTNLFRQLEDQIRAKKRELSQ